jgi:2'-5' RNA ligase
MGTIRSFIAIPLETGVVSRIEQTYKELKSLPADVKWVHPNAIHLTLKFLGNVEEKAVESISRGTQEGIKGFASWTVDVKNVGTFPSLRNPRVVWIGIEDTGGHLVALQNRIEEEMAKLGFEREERKFSPHLTLGRVRSPRGKTELIQYLADERERRFGEMKVDRVVLFKSELRSSGAIYTALGEFTFS